MEIPLALHLWLMQAFLMYIFILNIQNRNMAVVARINLIAQAEVVFCRCITWPLILTGDIKR